MEDRRSDSGVKRIQAFIAVAVILGFFATLGALMILKIEITNRELLLQMLGVLMAGFTGVIGYFLGASSAGTKKDEVIASIATTPTPVPVLSDPVKVDSTVPINVHEVSK